MYRVELSAQSRRDLDSLDAQTRKRILQKLKTLADNPRTHGTEKLTAQDNLYRNRVGVYRIIFEIRDATLLVLVLRVDHRSEAYRRRD